MTETAVGRALTVSTSTATRGGIATYVTMLAGTPLWSRWQVRHVVTHRDGSTALKIRTYLGALPRYAAALLVRRPDVVHLHMSSYGSFVRKALLLWLARAIRVPTLVHVHGSEFATFHDRLPRPGRAVVRCTLEAAQVVVALGERWGERLQAIAPGARVVTIPNGVRVPPPRRTREPGPVRVVFLGEIGERKGAFSLLTAWSQLVTELGPTTAHLTMAGDRGTDRARAAVAAGELRSSVSVSSWLSAAQVNELLERADVFVLPSRSEGQPMALLEAMAHGVCVVASDVGGIPEIVENGLSGLLVPPDDPETLAAALRKVVVDADLRAALGAAARERVVASFDIDVVWRRFDALYREVGRR